MLEVTVADAANITDVKRFVETSFAGALIVDEHGTMCNFEVSVPIPQIINRLKQSMSNFKIRFRMKLSHFFPKPLENLRIRKRNSALPTIHFLNQPWNKCFSRPFVSPQSKLNTPSDDIRVCCTTIATAHRALWRHI
jgi:hypothetical protein